MYAFQIMHSFFSHMEMNGRIMPWKSKGPALPPAGWHPLKVPYHWWERQYRWGNPRVGGKDGEQKNTNMLQVLSSSTYEKNAEFGRYTFFLSKIHPLTCYFQWMDGWGFQANGQQNHRGFGFATWKNTMGRFWWWPHKDCGSVMIQMI